MGDISSGAVKVVEIIGVSQESWEDAANKAVAKAAETIDNITGVEVTSFTAKVGDGGITRYQATCKLAFPVR